MNRPNAHQTKPRHLAISAFVWAYLTSDPNAGATVEIDNSSLDDNGHITPAQESLRSNVAEVSVSEFTQMEFQMRGYLVLST
jgi:hypothetical protein